MRSAPVVALTFTLASVGACSSSSNSERQPQPQQDGGTPSDSGMGEMDGVANDAAAVDSGSSSALRAPVITMATPMMGGLHVMWTNTETDCNSIEGERKSDSETYKVVFTIPDGSVDNKHDTPLTSGKAYTYRLRCKKGSDYSPYSNEKSGTS